MYDSITAKGLLIKSIGSKICDQLGCWGEQRQARVELDGRKRGNMNKREVNLDPIVDRVTLIKSLGSMGCYILELGKVKTNWIDIGRGKKRQSEQERRNY